MDTEGPRRDSESERETLAYGSAASRRFEPVDVGRWRLPATECAYEMRLASCVRDFTSSFRNTLPKWYSTVLGLMNS